jgi:hypothetical protein
MARSTWKVPADDPAPALTSRGLKGADARLCAAGVMPRFGEGSPKRREGGSKPRLRPRFRLPPRARLPNRPGGSQEPRRRPYGARARNTRSLRRGFVTDAARVTPIRPRAANASAEHSPTRRVSVRRGVSAEKTVRSGPSRTRKTRAQAGDTGLGMGATREARHPNPALLSGGSPEPRFSGLRSPVFGANTPQLHACRDGRPQQ